MGSATDYIEKAIIDLEAERDRIIAAIGQLRATLATFKNGSPVHPMEAEAKLVFQRKYEATAKELILNMLRETQKTMHVGQIQDELRKRGYQFKRPTVAVNVKALLSDDLVKQVKAPKSSGFSYSYVAVSEGLGTQEGAGGNYA